jgi:hypothetical protein
MLKLTLIVEFSRNFILKLQVKPVVLQIQTKPQLKTKKVNYWQCLFDKKIIKYFANRYTLRNTIIIW